MPPVANKSSTISILSPGSIASLCISITDFPYSNQLSFIFPDWPLRFQNTEFKTYLSSIINEYVPAQFEYEIYFININQLTVFEDTYFNWLDKKKNSEYEHLDSFALQLIQLLKSYKSI